MKRIALFAIRSYQVTLSPLFANGACRFTPGCSEYSRQAIARHGAIRGGLLTLWRVCRCHPWGGQGFDPIP